MQPLADNDDLRKRIDAVRWHHSFEVLPGLKTNGTYPPEGLWNRLSLPSDLRGKRILDVGARDGYFTLKATQSGAEVVAVDYERADAMGFALTMEANRINPRFVQANLYDLPRMGLGRFDIVLCLGVLYHVPDPYLALQVLRSLSGDGGMLLLESTNLSAGVEGLNGQVVLPENMRDLPLALYVRRNVTSFWDMTASCIRKITEDAGFKVEREQTWGKRVLLHATPATDVGKPSKKIVGDVLRSAKI